MAAKDTIWARFYEDHAELGFSERGEQPADTDIQFDMNVLARSPAEYAKQAILGQVARMIDEWLADAVGTFQHSAGDGEDVPF